MRFIDEFRDAAAVHKCADEIRRVGRRPWSIMEVCGGQTHTIVKYGIDRLLPEAIELLHGPGCPVCVTPTGLIDKALEIASQNDVIFCSFGDMLRVPGTSEDLLSVKARGGDVRIVYSPLDALNLATRNPGRRVVFFGIGFETTAPATAATICQAKLQEVRNFSVLVAQVCIPPAMERILSSEQARVDGFLAAGHVCTVTGCAEYESIARKHKVPITVTGFEPLDILQGILMTVTMLEEGRTAVENQYSRSVRREGNPEALKLMTEVFRTVDRDWRGLGSIPGSGLALSERYSEYDAERHFGPASSQSGGSPECISGLILQGIRKPGDCAAFGILCTPEHPLGATMVSSEGTCNAYFRYRKAIGPDRNEDSGR